MRNPFLCIVIPTFNRAGSILATIGSVRAQPRTDWEMIIVDDGSEDETEGVVKPLLEDLRISYYRQANQGVSAARNAGVAKSRSDFLIFLDSDDEMAPGFLDKAFELVSKNANAACFCFGAVFKRQDEQDNVLKPKNLGPLFLHKTGLFLAGTFILTAETFQRAGMYDPELAFGENDELGQRICRLGDIVCSDEISLISHRSPRTEKNKRYRREIMAKTLVHYLDVYREELERVDKKKLITLNNRLAVCYFVMNQRNQAISLLIQMVRNYRSVKSIRILARIIFFPGLYGRFLNKKGFI